MKITKATLRDFLGVSLIALLFLGITQIIVNGAGLFVWLWNTKFFLYYMALSFISSLAILTSAAFLEAESLKAMLGKAWKGFVNAFWGLILLAVVDLAIAVGGDYYSVVYWKGFGKLLFYFAYLIIDGLFTAYTFAFIYNAVKGNGSLLEPFKMLFKGKVLMGYFGIFLFDFMMGIAAKYGIASSNPLIIGSIIGVRLLLFYAYMAFTKGVLEGKYVA